MKVVAVIQARMSSSRLPGKVLKDLGGQEVIRWCVEAARDATGVDDVVVATSINPENDIIEHWATSCAKLRCIRGSEDDVLSRYMDVVQATKASVLVRITGDCPFIDPEVIGSIIALQKATGYDYVANTEPPTFPDGLDCEVFTAKALLQAHKKATRATDRECVTRYLVRNRSTFPAGNVTCPVPGLHKERWVLDSPEDYQFLQEIAKRLGRRPASYLDILQILNKEPELRKINGHLTRNERFFASLETEETSRTYPRSNKHLAEAADIIPLASQTYSKSKLQFPVGSPLFLSHGDGATVYDIDGNDYVDLVSALLPNILGYRDPDVDWAVRSQLNSGISLSLSTELEYQLASLLKRHIPCAEMVKFGKNGSDVTSAAIRLARYFSGRDHVIVVGYHGWHDWSIGWDVERSRGVPPAIRNLSHKVDYGDLDKIEDLLKKRNVAAVILEPDGGGLAAPKDHLEHLQKLCRSHDVVLIFDEVITGFRWDLGGYQTYCGIVPDLATFGKAMGNGMPISALCGRKDIMKYMDRVCYSGTFFGETLSLAASIATIEKMERENTPGKLWDTGGKLAMKARTKVLEYELGHQIGFYGDLPLIRLRFKDHPNATAEQIKTLFLREMIASGALLIASHNVTAAHGDSEMARILKSYDHALGVVAESLKKNQIGSMIEEAIGSNVSVR